MTSLQERLLTQVPDIDKSITPNGVRLMQEKYCLPGESVALRLVNACLSNSWGFNHATRLARYIRDGWFMFSTPLLANSGTERGQGISCFLNMVPDSREGLADLYSENVWLTTGGGGVGTHWSAMRSRGQSTSTGSETTGVIPFIKIEDSQILALNQGLTRRGAGAAWLSVSHPEIMEFLSIRDLSGGDINRKSPNLHIGVLIPDEFMEAVIGKRDWDLVDPHTKEVVATLPAMRIWIKILQSRLLAKGEPYLYFTDNVRKNTQYNLNDSQDPIQFNGSNLCTEILLHTSADETAVCCLSSVNAYKFHEYVGHDDFYSDMVLMLNVALENFITRAPEGYSRAVLAARLGRDIGLGIMGYQSLVQSGLDAEAVFEYHKEQSWAASEEQLGYLPGAERARHLGRVNTHVTAIAPNASSSIMLGVSPGIEPMRSNVFVHKVGNLSLEVRNPVLEDHLEVYYPGETEEIWAAIAANGGSCQGVLPDDESGRFKTFLEHDQLQLIKDAAARQKHIDQGQSLNLCVSPSVSAEELSELHIKAWELGLPTMYYLRTEAQSRAENVTVQVALPAACPITKPSDGECLACQG